MKVCTAPAASLTASVTVDPGGRLLVPVMRGVLSLLSAGASTVTLGRSATLTVRIALAVPPRPSLTVYVTGTAPLTPGAAVKVSVPSALMTTLPRAGATVAPVTMSGPPSTSVSLPSTAWVAGAMPTVLTLSALATGASLTAARLICVLPVAADVPLLTL